MLQDSKIRHREVSSEFYQTLANSLSIDQIRLGLSWLAPGKKIPVKARKDVLSALEKTGKSIKEICEILLKIESRTAFRHCLITQFSGNSESLLNLISGTEFSGNFATYTINYVDRFDRGFVLTISHTVEVIDWVTAENGESQSKQRRYIRHPINIRIYESDAVALISYPGFSQGAAASRSTRVAYQGLAEDVIQYLNTHCKIVFSTFPVEKCLHLLAVASNSRVKIVRTDLEPPNGRLNISSAYKVASVEDIFLRSFLRPVLTRLNVEINDSDLHKIVAEVMHQAQTNSMTVSWVREGVVTRVDFWTIGAELLFIWNDVESSVFIVDSIVDLLVSVSKQLAKTHLSDLWDWLSKLDSESVLSIGNIVSKFNIQEAEAKEVLFKSISLGMFEPVYRLATTELLMESSNDWTEKLSSLSALFTTESGHEIDGGNPANIQVAFRKVLLDGGEK